MSRKIKLFFKGHLKVKSHFFFLNYSTDIKITLSNCHRIFQTIPLNFGTYQIAHPLQTVDQHQFGGPCSQEDSSQRHHMLEMSSAPVPGMNREQGLRQDNVAFRNSPAS